MQHPIQPIYKDNNDIIRFKENAIVTFLAKDRLNELSQMNFSQEDWEQLAQLIGYSLSGFSELSYVTDMTYNTVVKIAESGKSEELVRIEYLESTLKEVRNKIREIVPLIFRIHEDDLHV